MIRGGLAFVAALVLAGLPAAFRWSDGGAFAVDGAVLVVLAVLLPRTERRAVPAVLAACWVLLLVFEGGMLGGRSTMGEDPVVYDGIQLLWHLGVVLQDLYGPWRFWGAVGAGLLATVALSAAAFFAFRLLVRGPWRVLPGGMAVLVGVAGVGVAGPHVATALAADRIAASVELYARFQGLRHSDAHARHMA
ncbi:MAG: hypothetical protein H6736_19350, partial [Alphaproteobacteria bacterium]|nr:hypothetical protein [Alphaproteobacteria bacterium]